MLGKLDHYIQRMKLDYHLKPYIKINTKLNKEIDIRTQAIVHWFEQCLEENTGKALHDTDFSDVFMNLFPVVK